MILDADKIDLFVFVFVLFLFFLFFFRVLQKEGLGGRDGDE